MENRDLNRTSGPNGAEDKASAGAPTAMDATGAGRVIRSIVDYLRRVQLRAETARALGELDIRTLKDIGVHPHDVPWLATRLTRAGNDNWRPADNDNLPKKDGTRSIF